jgi:hypothetical protein
VRHNPGWEITVLNGDSLCDWADPALCQARAQSLSLNHLSDLARLNLLTRYGGVWADATCYCMKPLDEWLPAQLESGFFAFANPGPDRVMSSWFLASQAGGYIPRRMWEELGDYFLRRNLSATGWRSLAARPLARILNRNARSAQLWFAPPLPQLGITPYFGFHYMFARLVRTDPSFRRIWERTAKVSAERAHHLQLQGMDRPPSPQLLAELELRQVPVYKLDWRVDPRMLPESSAVNVLIADY